MATKTELTADYWMALFKSKGEKIDYFDDFIERNSTGPPTPLAETVTQPSSLLLSKNGTVNEKSNLNYICLLNELLVDDFRQVKFSFPVSKTPSVFLCLAEYQGHTISGDGKSKQLAKQDACHQLFKILMAKKMDPDSEKRKPPPPQPQPPTSSSEVAKTEPVKMDYISELNLLCQQNKRFGRPEFSSEPQNDQSFKITAKVNELRTTGHGTKKQSAKQLAAKQMLELIRNKYKIE